MSINLSLNHPSTKIKMIEHQNTIGSLEIKFIIPTFVEHEDLQNPPYIKLNKNLMTFKTCDTWSQSTNDHFISHDNENISNPLHENHKSHDANYFNTYPYWIEKYGLPNTHKCVIKQHWMADGWTYVQCYANDLHKTFQKSTIWPTFVS